MHRESSRRSVPRLELRNFLRVEGVPEGLLSPSVSRAVGRPHSNRSGHRSPGWRGLDVVLNLFNWRGLVALGDALGCMSACRSDERMDRTPRSLVWTGHESHLSTNESGTIDGRAVFSTGVASHAPRKMGTLCLEAQVEGVDQLRNRQAPYAKSPKARRCRRISRMASFRHLLHADLTANQTSAKGRLVMRLFRIGQALPPRLRRFYHPIYYGVVDVLMGISLPLETQVGPGLLLRHGQGVVVSWKSRIGAGCEIHQNVTLGEKDSAAPELGDGVTIGANAVLLGGILIGNGAVIGAGAVVLSDVPAGATAVGIAARTISAPATP